MALLLEERWDHQSLAECYQSRIPVPEEIFPDTLILFGAGAIVNLTARGGRRERQEP
jgi:hypothetical protein